MLHVAHRRVVGYGQARQIDRIVARNMERRRSHIERIELALGVAQSQFEGRGLQRLLRVVGRETERLPAIDNHLTQTEGDVHDALLGAFVANGVVVDRARHTRQRREEITIFQRTAHLLHDDRHLLLAQQVRRGGDICTAGGEVDRGIDALDRLAQQTQHLALVLGVGDHIGRVDTRKGLVM